MKINGLARALVAALLVTAGASAHAYTNNVQSCTASGGGACETGWVTVQEGKIHVFWSTTSYRSCGQWYIRNGRHEVVKSGGWYYGARNGDKTFSVVNGLYYLKVDPGAGKTCAFPKGSVTGKLVGTPAQF